MDIPTFVVASCSQYDRQDTRSGYGCYGHVTAGADYPAPPPPPQLDYAPSRSVLVILVH